ncbi:MAG TPA: NAD(+) kinase [Methylophilaceae bacterium]|jgi:NAD+ kinase
MKSSFKSVALIGKYMNSSMREQILTLARFLVERGIAVFVEENTAIHLDIKDYEIRSMQAIGAETDLAVVIGGDGTMLTAARALGNFNIPLVGVNRGTFGFLTDISSDLMLSSMERIIAGEYTLEQRIMLCADVERKGEMVSKGRAINDVVVSKGATARLIELEMTIDGQPLTRQRTDGLVVATPTGSTAYALSAGGPVLHPALDAIIIVPICPHSLTSRPIIIHNTSQVDIRFTRGENARIQVDGLPYMELELGDIVHVKRHELTVTFLHPADHSHYKVLREKLHWG